VSTEGYVGLPGSGKTLRAAQIGSDDLALGRDVYANIDLGRRESGYIVPRCERHEALQIICWERPWRSWTPTHTGDLAAEFVPDSLLSSEDRRFCAEVGFRRGRGFVVDPKFHRLTSWEQVVAIRESRDAFDKPHKLRLVYGGVRETKDGPEEIWTAEPECNVWSCHGCSKGITIVLDELNLWAPSRFWATLGIGVLTRFAYTRKDGIRLVWTAQHEARIDKVAREVTDFIYSCSSIGGKFTLPSGRVLIHLQLFYRRKWIPAMLTDKNRLAAGEGVEGGGVSGVLNSQIAWWWSMAKYADRYRTYEHVPIVTAAGRGSGAAAEARQRPAALKDTRRVS
jgi:hypothetical protein